MLSMGSIARMLAYSIWIFVCCDASTDIQGCLDPAFNSIDQACSRGLWEHSWLPVLVAVGRAILDDHETWGMRNMTHRRWAEGRLTNIRSETEMFETWLKGVTGYQTPGMYPAYMYEKTLFRNLPTRLDDNLRDAAELYQLLKGSWRYMKMLSSRDDVLALKVRRNVQDPVNDLLMALNSSYVALLGTLKQASTGIRKDSKTVNITAAVNLDYETKIGNKFGIHNNTANKELLDASHVHQLASGLERDRLSNPALPTSDVAYMNNTHDTVQSMITLANSALSLSRNILAFVDHMQTDINLTKQTIYTITAADKDVGRRTTSRNTILSIGNELDNIARSVRSPLNYLYQLVPHLYSTVNWLEGLVRGAARDKALLDGLAYRKVQDSENFERMFTLQVNRVPGAALILAVDSLRMALPTQIWNIRQKLWMAANILHCPSVDSITIDPRKLCPSATTETSSSHPEEATTTPLVIYSTTTKRSQTDEIVPTICEKKAWGATNCYPVTTGKITPSTPPTSTAPTTTSTATMSTIRTSYMSTTEAGKTSSSAYVSSTVKTGDELGMVTECEKDFWSGNIICRNVSNGNTTPTVYNTTTAKTTARQTSPTSYSIPTARPGEGVKNATQQNGMGIECVEDVWTGDIICRNASTQNVTSTTTAKPVTSASTTTLASGDEEVEPGPTQHHSVVTVCNEDFWTGEIICNDAPSSDAANPTTPTTMTVTMTTTTMRLPSSTPLDQPIENKATTPVRTDIPAMITVCETSVWGGKTICRNVSSSNIIAATTVRATTKADTTAAKNIPPVDDCPLDGICSTQTTGLLNMLSSVRATRPATVPADKVPTPCPTDFWGESLCPTSDDLRTSTASTTGTTLPKGCTKDSFGDIECESDDTPLDSVIHLETTMKPMTITRSPNDQINIRCTTDIWGVSDCRPKPLEEEDETTATTTTPASIVRRTTESAEVSTLGADCTTDVWGEVVCSTVSDKAVTSKPTTDRPSNQRSSTTSQSTKITASVGDGAPTACNIWGTKCWPITTTPSSESESFQPFGTRIKRDLSESFDYLRKRISLNSRGSESTLDDGGYHSFIPPPNIYGCADPPRCIDTRRNLIQAQLVNDTARDVLQHTKELATTLQKHNNTRLVIEKNIECIRNIRIRITDSTREAKAMASRRHAQMERTPDFHRVNRKASHVHGRVEYISVKVNETKKKTNNLKKMINDARDSINDISSIHADLSEVVLLPSQQQQLRYKHFDMKKRIDLLRENIEKLKNVIRNAHTQARNIEIPLMFFSHYPYSSEGTVRHLPARVSFSIRITGYVLDHVFTVVPTRPYKQTAGSVESSLSLRGGFPVLDVTQEGLKYRLILQERVPVNTWIPFEVNFVRDTVDLIQYDTKGDVITTASTLRLRNNMTHHDVNIQIGGFAWRERPSTFCLKRFVMDDEIVPIWYFRDQSGRPPDICNSTARQPWSYERILDNLDILNNQQSRPYSDSADLTPAVNYLGILLDTSTFSRFILTLNLHVTGRPDHTVQLNLNTIGMTVELFYNSAGQLIISTIRNGTTIGKETISLEPGDKTSQEVVLSVRRARMSLYLNSNWVATMNFQASPVPNQTIQGHLTWTRDVVMDMVKLNNRLLYEDANVAGSPAST